MKIKFIVIAFILIMTSCLSSPKVVINATIEDAKDQMIYIVELDNEQYVKTDSTMMRDGKFRFEIQNDYPRPATLSFAVNRNISIPIVIEKGHIDIEGTVDQISNCKISGSETMQMISDFAKIISPLQSRNYFINKSIWSESFDSLPDEERAAMQQKLLNEYSKNSFKINFLTDSVIRANNDNIFGASLIGDQQMVDIIHVDETLARISDKMPKNKFIDNLRALRKKFAALEIGATAPDFTIPQPGGNSITLSSLRGEVVLLNFWASWSVPCRTANSEMAKLHKNFHDKMFTIFSISIDRDNDKWMAAIKEDGMNWYHGSNLSDLTCPVVKSYFITSIPQYFLIDKDGTIITKGNDLKKIEEAISKKLNRY